MSKLFTTLFRTKSMKDLTAEDSGDGPKLAKVLTARDVFFHGVAAIIGTGIFVLTGVAAAEHAGPAIMLSFLIAGLACTFVSFAYSELASMIPKSGSAYTYAYATLGEVIAFIIGWDLLLEYCVGASAVAVGWSGYMQNILHGFGIYLPDVLAKAPEMMPWHQVVTAAMALILGGITLRSVWTHLSGAAQSASGSPKRLLLGTVLLTGVGLLVASVVHSLWPLGFSGAFSALAVMSSAPMFWVYAAGSAVAVLVAGVAMRSLLSHNLGLTARYLLSIALFAVSGAFVLDALHYITSVDILAVAVIAFINYWLIRGVKHTAKMTAWFVVIKLAVIAMFIAIGMWHVDATNYVPFMPFGWAGVFTGAAVVFFAYIGFDAVSTLPEECKDPERDMPKGIIGSLGVCGVLYVIVAAIMVGCVTYTMFDPKLPSGAAPMATVLNAIHAPWWASALVSVGAIAGITSVLIVLLFGQSRVMMSMSRDGLISPIFSKINAKYQTPVWSIVIWGVLAALTSGFIPIGELAALTSIGTLAAFVLCCVGVMVLRRTEPDRKRLFRCPKAPLVVPAARVVSLVVPASRRPGFLAGATWLAENMVPILGALFSIALMASLPLVTWIRFVVWMVIGLIIYFIYGRFHSKLDRRQ